MHPEKTVTGFMYLDIYWQMEICDEILERHWTSIIYRQKLLHISKFR